MKKFVLMAAMAMVSLGAFCQEGLSFGPKIGLNIANMTNMDTDSRVGMNVGIFAQYRFNQWIGVQPEVLYSMQGAKADALGFTGTMKVDYINVPILAKLYVFNGLNIELGPQFGFCTRAKGDVSFDGDSWANGDLKDNVNTFDFGIAMGVAYDFDFGLTANARYVAGTTDVIKNSDVRNSVFQIGVGYKF